MRTLMTRKVAIRLLCIALLLVCIGSLIYFVLSKRTDIATLKKAKNITKNEQSEIPIGSGDVSDSSTWLRYTYRTSWAVSYPPNWKVVPDYDGNGVAFQTLGFQQDDDTSTPYGNGGKVEYTVFDQNNVSQMSTKNGDVFPSDDGSETFVVANLTHFKISGYPAIEFDYYPTDNVHFFRTMIIVQHKSVVYAFKATYAQANGKLMSEKMLQTLRFL